MEENRIEFDRAVSPSMRVTSLLRAAEPFLPSSITDSVDILIKAVELTASMQEVRHHKKGFFAKQTEEEIDFDGLLHSVRRFCSKKEQGFIDKILNMKNTMKMMKTYQEMMSIFSQLSMGTGNKENTTHTQQEDSAEQSNGFSPEMMDVLEQMLPPEQKETFETMKLLLSSGMLQNL